MTNVWQQWQVPAGDAAEADDYSEWTKAELQAESERRGLPKSGTKDELIARLSE